MTAVAIGGSSSFSVQDGGIVTITTNGGLGSATVSQTGGTGFTETFGPLPYRRSYGPFSEGGSVVVTNLSCPSLDVDAPVSFLPYKLAAPNKGIESVSMFGTFTAGTIGNTTFMNAYAMESPFVQARIGIINASPASLTIANMGFAIGDVFTNNHPTTNAVASGIQQCTYNGGTAVATTPMVCAAAVGGVPSITFTDWQAPLVVGVAMTANPSLYPLYVMANVSTLAGFFVCQSTGLNANPNNVSGGRFKKGSSRGDGGGNAVNGAYTAAQFAQTLPMVVQTRALRKTLRVAVLGDSTWCGNALPDGGDTNCWLIDSCNKLNASQSSMKFSALNWAWGGQTTATYSGRLATLLAAEVPDVLIYQVYGNNDGAASTAAVDAMQLRARTVIDQCAAVGTTVVLGTSIPINSASITTDNFRKACDVRTRQLAADMGLALLDFDAALSAGGSPAQALPGIYVDTQHPNAIGRDLQSAVAIPYLRALAAAA